MSRRAALIVGVTKTRVRGFPALPAVDEDVRIFEDALATYETTTKIGIDATVNTVHGAIQSKHAELQPGDTFVFAFSGHGSRRSDPQSPEPDHHREALVMSDQLYADTMLRSALHGFRAGVNVIAIIDACHAAGASFLEEPPKSTRGLVWRRGEHVSGATTLTLAAAPEDALAMQRPGKGGLLTSCLEKAVTSGTSLPSWQAVWDEMSAWAITYRYKPIPEAWLDGPDPPDERILQAAPFG